MSAKITAAAKIYAAAKSQADAGVKSVKLDRSDVVKLVKAKLTATFPGVKFSVRAGSCCIDVRWTDGPSLKQVKPVADQFSFGGFDGMIDMSFDVDNYLLPDGSMVACESSGTGGSRGSVPGFNFPAPSPEAVRVESYCGWISCQHDTTEEYDMALIRKVAARFGFTVDESKPSHEQRFNGDLPYLWIRHYEAVTAA